MSHPTWVCGLKLTQSKYKARSRKSHPTWVCGLKQSKQAEYISQRSHTLRGCVD